MEYQMNKHKKTPSHKTWSFLNIMEMRQTNQPIGRPRQLYTGAATRDYVEMSAR